MRKKHNPYTQISIVVLMFVVLNQNSNQSKKTRLGLTEIGNKLL